MKNIFYLILSLCLINCNSQNNMEILSSGDIDNNQLVLNFQDNNLKSSWSLYIKSKSGSDSLLIDTFEKKIKIPGIKKGDVSKHVIIGASIKNEKSLYVTLYKFSKIFLVEYDFTKKNKVKKHEYFIGEDFRGSYDNFGDPIFSSKIRKTDNYLFISAQYCGLVKYNILNESIKRVRFFDTKPQPKLISPNEKYPNKVSIRNKDFKFGEKIIKMVIVSEDINLLLQKRKENKSLDANIPEEKSEILDNIKTGIDNTYYFYEIQKESDSDLLWNNNIDNYKLYNSVKIDLKKETKITEKVISDILKSYDLNSEKNVKLLDYLLEYRNENIICFFYKQNSVKIEIIRYNYDEHEWYLGNYLEEDINQ